MIKKINKTLLFINLLFLQSYLFRLSIPLGNLTLPTNLQEILIITNLAFLVLSKLKWEKNLNNFKPYKLKKNILNLISRHKIICIFICLSLFTIITNTHHQTLDFIRHLKFLFFASILSFIFFETFKKTKQQIKGIKILGVGALLFGVFSFVINVLGYQTAYDLRLKGPLDSAVYLAYYLSPFFLYSSIRLFESLRSLSLTSLLKNKNFFPSLIFFLLILCTKSMGALGASFIILSIYLFKNNKTLKFLKTKIFKLIYISILIILTSTIFYIKILPTINTNYSSLDERGEIWETSISLLKTPQNAIFGVGLGQFEDKYIKHADQVLKRPPLDYFIIQPHNIFLLFIFQFGVLGFIFLLTLIFKTFKTINKAKSPLKHHEVISLVFLYFLIHGLIDTPIFKNDILILFFIFTQIIFAKIKTDNKKQLKTY